MEYAMFIDLGAFRYILLAIISALAVMWGTGDEKQGNAAIGSLAIAILIGALVPSQKEVLQVEAKLGHCKKLAAYCALNKDNECPPCTPRPSHKTNPPNP